jgi:uroporphyrinogen III methyltransferase / synthase
MNGKVYLVGAGPGDPGLLTLKGKAALERADSVVYDFLAASVHLRHAPPEAEKIFVGKRGGGPRRPQEEINSLLIAKARAGQTVVRLKGGDPFIFGRGGEEAQALVKAGVPFEIVPGISAGIAAPAYAGIPLTHRDLASAVCFAAGHENPAKMESGVDWAGLATASGTLVFFMGTRNLGLIARQLIEQGRPAGTPVAVIRWGTRAQQQVVTGSLSEIAARAANLAPPTVIVVGEVVRLREELNWFERLPLFGKRIVVTRAREQAAPFCDRLEELGAEAVTLPTIEFREPQSWSPLDDAIARLQSFHYLLLTSANGVRSFMGRLLESGRDARDLKGLVIGAIGPATAAEFSRYGIRVDVVPSHYQAEGLLEALKGHDVRGKAVLIPRAKVARDLVPQALTERGARVEVVEAYETVTPKLDANQAEELMRPLPDALTFTSSSTVANFSQIFPAGSLAKTLQGVAIASIGPITSQTIRKLGLEVAIEAKESTLPGLTQALVHYFQGK